VSPGIEVPKLASAAELVLIKWRCYAILGALGQGPRVDQLVGEIMLDSQPPNRESVLRLAERTARAMGNDPRTKRLRR